MAGSSRAELSASGIDGPAFAATTASANGQRGAHAHAGSGFERSGSFRESSEGRGQFAGSGASRNAAVSPAEPPPLAQYLTLEPIVLGEPKYSRSGELRRILGVTVEEQSFGLVQTKPLPSIASEELKRIRASMMESSIRARDRAKSLQESIQKLDKYRNILTRKRQRSDMSTEKSGSSNVLRMGTQAHQNSAENLSQRLEERTKNVVTSKRVRSSLAEARLEGRGSVPTRQGPLVDNEKSSSLEKEKSSVRTSSVVPGLSEDKLRGLSPGGEGWEKKLKRKRSVGTMLNRGNDVDRDVKPAVQHRPNNEVRVRSSDGLAFRHGASTGALGGSKMDGSSQQSNAGSRFVPKTDMDFASLPNERRERERVAGLDKERVMAKGNKAHSSEDVQAGSLSPLTKGKACRAPRTSSVVVMNSSSSFLRSSGGTDEWEEAPCTNKVPPSGGTTNRKRPVPPSASSPPVAWGGQRPQKMSRTRRANVVSPVSNFDEAQVLSEGLPLDVAGRSAPIESCGLLLARGVPSNNLQTVSKMDNISSPVGLSESEGSAATENKTKEKATNSGEVENGGGNTIHSAADLIFASKKSRIPLKEELADGGVRRQGRSGRGTMQVKACSSVSKEKLDTIETMKPLKSGRPGSEKNESKVGRPPTKKGSDRKASSRHAQILNYGSIDATGQSDDDREELLAAANGARNAIVAAYSGSFWKKMEPMLTFVSSEDLSFLQHQITFVEELETGMSSMLDGEHNMIISTNYSGPLTTGELSSQVLPSSNSSMLLEQCETNGVEPKKPIGISSPNDDPHIVASRKIEADRWFDEMAPLTHRLLSAFMEEDGNEFSECNSVQGDILLEFSNDFVPYITKRHLENECEASAIKSNFGLGLDFRHSNNHAIHKSMCNGFTASSNFRSSNIQNSIYCENLSDGSNNVTVHPGDSPLHEFMPNISRQYQNLGKSFSGSPYEYQYGHMSLDDKILIELHSIDIYPETMPKLDEGEDEDINKVISELKTRLYEQVKQKKCQLHNLEKAIQDTKSVEERSLEQHAMNKLVEMAYKRLTGGRGGSSHKGGITKAAKQIALGFAKRTLARCQKFEETGQSCFSEPFLWSVLSAPLHSSDSKLIEGATPGIVERSKLQKLDRSPLDHGNCRIPEQSLGKHDCTSNREKKEVLLDDVVTSLASRATSTLGTPFPGGAKWKKSDRERDQHRDTSAKSSSLKSGRHSSSSGRSERKNKTKPKQKLAQLSTSGNVLGRVVESPNFSTSSMRESCETMNTSYVRIDQQVKHSSANAAQESSNAALTNLPGIDPIDMLDVPEELDGQGHDIASWFGLDDDSLQDLDFIGGLEVPDDDLSQLGFCLK